MVDCLGPLTPEQMLENQSRRRIPREAMLEGMPYEQTYAWVLGDGRPLPEPVPYCLRTADAWAVGERTM